MDPRFESKYDQLLFTAVKRVKENLNAEFNSGKTRYNLTSRYFQSLVEREILAIFPEKLSDAQETVLQKLTDQELNALVNHIAGKMEINNQSASIVTGKGFKVSGWTKIFFDDLNANLFPSDNVATTNILKNRPRNKKIILTFLSELAIYADQSELKALKSEANRRGVSALVDVLAKHRVQKGIFKTDKDTKSLTAYKAALVNIIPFLDDNEKSDNFKL